MVQELINSFKGKFQEPKITDDFDFAQFVLSETNELPTLVIMPYNVHNIRLQQAYEKGLKDAELNAV